MIDVSELMDDPDFCASFTVLRTTGRWVKGEFILDEPERLNWYHPVQPAAVRELEQLPEGDRQKGVMKFFCKRPKQFHMTRADADWQNSDKGGLSDEIVYLGNTYKIIQVLPWDANGFQRAFGVLKELG